MVTVPDLLWWIGGYVCLSALQLLCFRFSVTQLLHVVMTCLVIILVVATNVLKLDVLNHFSSVWIHRWWVSKASSVKIPHLTGNYDFFFCVLIHRWDTKRHMACYSSCFDFLFPVVCKSFIWLDWLPRKQLQGKDGLAVWEMELQTPSRNRRPVG